MQALQSRLLSADNLVEQLEAVVGLWGDVRRQWRQKWFAAKPVPTTMPWKPTAQVSARSFSAVCVSEHRDMLYSPGGWSVPSRTSAS